MFKNPSLPAQKNFDWLVISLNSPLLSGIYQEDKLIRSFSYSQRTGDALVAAFLDVREFCRAQSGSVKGIFYAAGPGAFTSIKLTHVFLQTLSIAHGIGVASADGFCFNGNSPIKAFGNKFFVKNAQGRIELCETTGAEIADFALPKRILRRDFRSPVAPLYVLPPL